MGRVTVPMTTNSMPLILSMAWLGIGVEHPSLSGSGVGPPSALGALLQKFWKWLIRLFAPQRRPRSRARGLRFSWVIPGKLAVGDLPRPGDSTVLEAARIIAILSLCSEREGQLPADVSAQFHCGRLVLPDSHYSTPMSPEDLGKAVEVVHRALQRQMPLYVHCLGGIERSPLVCLAYLCQHRSLRVVEALHWLKQVHPPTSPTSEQLRVLEVYLSQLQARQG
ncbi:MAG: dual specificity protein phosphatase family protein [Synechococcaceae cyanobacterium SM2_3_1]|nr:dual specificity protein phosphatase family protein [Synechococcaceae cyanobacterium SM2_3_1]